MLLEWEVRVQHRVQNTRSQSLDSTAWTYDYMVLSFKLLQTKIAVSVTVPSMNDSYSKL